jgi:hypothetical protein
MNATVVQTQSAPTANKSKYGYHSCSYEIFVLLRQINRATFKARRQSAAWERWRRKAPRNRKCSEPNLTSPLLSKAVNQPWHMYIGRYDYDCQNAHQPGEVLLLDNLAVVAEADYRKARMPVPTQEQVQPLQLTEAQIRVLATRVA